MPRRFGPGFVANADQGAALNFAPKARGRRWELRYSPAAEALQIAKSIDDMFAPPARPILLAEGDRDGMERGLQLSPADASMMVRATSGLIKEVARTEPIELLRLSDEIETVSLRAMIARVRERIESGHSEGSWQTFLTENAFILRMAFGVPVLLFKGQATVGGRGYSGGGDKRADFLMRAARSGNLSIVEIKTPATKQLRRNEGSRGRVPPERCRAGGRARAPGLRSPMHRPGRQDAQGTQPAEVLRTLPQRPRWGSHADIRRAAV